MEQHHDIERSNRFNFRSALNALANPGRSYPIQPVFDSGLLALASVLLYAEVSYYYTGSQDFRLIGALTGAREASLSGADYLFADTVSLACIRESRSGTAEHPEQGASLIVDCRGETACTAVTLQGPGIQRQLATSLPLAPDIIVALAEKNSTFPLGIDLFLLRAGNGVIGLPRTTTIGMQA